MQEVGAAQADDRGGAGVAGDIEDPLVIHRRAGDRAGPGQVQLPAAKDVRFAGIGIGPGQRLGSVDGQAALPADGAFEGPGRIAQGQGVGPQRHCSAGAVQADDRCSAGVAGNVEGPAVDLQLRVQDRARAGQVQDPGDRRLAGVAVDP